MKQVFTCKSSSSPKQHLTGMFKATENGELDIAHYIDDLSVGTVESEDKANYILKCKMTWRKDNYMSVYDEFERVLADI